MNDSARISTWLLQYWYQLRNAVPMLSNIGAPVRAEEGPAFLFSTSFSPRLLDTDFVSRFSLVPWMTYRKDFEPIEGYASDCGWGCMLRSAQMMLAEALFRRECAQGSSVASRTTREKVLRLFADTPHSPYSLHEMSRRALRYGKHAGEWFEPTLTLLIVCEMLKDREKVDHLRAIVARDGLLDASSLVVAADEPQTFASSDPLLHPPRQVQTSTLLLIPLRLGLRELNDEIYGRALIEALRFPQSVGMIGGKPAHSLYFCGSQGSKLVFLDPHTVQPYSTCADLQSYQCPDARAMSIKEVDPSLALGFLVSSYEDFMDLKQRVESLPGPAMFSISTKPVDFLMDGEDMLDDEDDELQGTEDEEFEQVGVPSSPHVATAPPPLQQQPKPQPQLQEEEEEDVVSSFTDVTRAEAKSPPKKKEEFVFL